MSNSRHPHIPETGFNLFFLFHRRRIFNQPGIRSTKRLGSQGPSEIGLGVPEQVWTPDWQGQDFSGKTEHSKSKH